MRTASICVTVLVGLWAMGCAEAPTHQEEEKAQLESAIDSPVVKERQRRTDFLAAIAETLDKKGGFRFTMITEGHFRESDVFEYVERIKAHYAKRDGDPSAVAYFLNDTGGYVIETNSKTGGQRLYIYEDTRELKGLLLGKFLGDKTITWLLPLGICEADAKERLACRLADDTGFYSEDPPAEDE